jgi:DNA-binding NarL/FixJ family response regulator
MQKLLRVAIYENHTFIREALISSFSKHPDFEIAGEAVDFLHLIKTIIINEPNILVMNLKSPIFETIYALKYISKNYPNIMPIVFSTYFDDDKLQKIFLHENLTNLFFGNTTHFSDVIQKITLNAQQKVFYHTLTSIIVKSANNQIEKDSLTKREIDILRQVRKGYSNKQMAANLFVSNATVDFHLRNIRAKLNVFSKTDLVFYAIENSIE